MVEKVKPFRNNLINLAQSFFNKQGYKYWNKLFLWQTNKTYGDLLKYEQNFKTSENF